MGNLKEQIIDKTTKPKQGGAIQTTNPWSTKALSMDTLVDGCATCKNNNSSPIYSISKTGLKGKHISKLGDTVECKCKVKAFNLKKIRIKKSIRCIKTVSYYL